LISPENLARFLIGVLSPGWRSFEWRIIDKRYRIAQRDKSGASASEPARPRPATAFQEFA